MSEELKPPYTGPISAETARLRAQQAVDYYQKKLQSRESSSPRSNAYEKSDRSGHSYINGRHSAATVQAELPDRFLRGGHRATIHSTQGPKGWKPKRVDNPGIDKSMVEKSTVRTQGRHGRGLYRSNSNLEMDSFEYTEEEEQVNVSSVSSKREYGSTSSLDMMSTSGESFFAMLNNLKTINCDQRSPAPAKFQEVLRGRAEPEKPATVSFANAEILERIANGSLLGASNMGDAESEDNTQSPKSKTKLKHKDRKLRSKSITAETGPGVVRNIRRKNEIDSGTRTSDNLSDTEIRGDDRFRRKAFVHYDCQSIGFDIESVMKNQNSSTAILNMATGASAASLNRNSYAGEADDPDIIANTDDGDGRNNELVQSCPFFRNEIGGEKERTIGLTRSTAHSPMSSEASSHYRSAITVTRSPMCCGVSVLDSSPTPTGHILPPHVIYKDYVIEYVDHGAYYYRHFFNGSDHQNYFGIDDNLGPVAVSVKREKLDERENNLGKSEGGLYQYRIIIRSSELVTLRGCILEDTIPSSSRLGSSRGVHVKEALEYVARELQVSCLRQGIASQKTYDQLMKVDEQGIWSTYKVGIMYCKAGQSTEEEMYNNEHAGPAFEEFLNLIGQKVELKGFEKYRAQLDNKIGCMLYKVKCGIYLSTHGPYPNSINFCLGNHHDADSTGTHSVYTTFNNCEIMFHVSTLLPFTPSNRQQEDLFHFLTDQTSSYVAQQHEGEQQWTDTNPEEKRIFYWTLHPHGNHLMMIELLRKRHIGNDIVTIVFQEHGSLPFTPRSVRSQFQHVFIIIKVHHPCSDQTSYSIAVSRSKDVPPFGPPIPEKARFPKTQEFADFLLAKVINAENAAHHSEKFRAMAIRTRQEYLKDLANNYTTSNSLESGSKLSKFGFSSGRKKEKNLQKVVPDYHALGALVWRVQVEDVGQASPVICLLGIAAETLVIIEESTKSVIFTTHCGAVIGWTSQAISLRLYYNQGDCLVLKSLEMEELKEIVTRLQAVTLGCETDELSLRRNGLGQLGFHIQSEGIVTDVESSGFAFSAGLRKGSRLVEICKVATTTLSHDQMVDLLRTSATVKVVAIAPLDDGSPRGVVNLHVTHHYTSSSALHAVIQAEYSLHKKKARSASISTEHAQCSSPTEHAQNERGTPVPIRRTSNTLPLQKKTSSFSASTSSPRGDVKIPPNRIYYTTESWQSSSLPRSETIGNHGYSDSTMSSGRGSLYDSREVTEGFPVRRAQDDSLYGTLEEKHSRSGSKDSNEMLYGGRDWSSIAVSSTGPGRQRTGTLPSSQGGLSSESGSQPNFLTSTESLYSSTPQTTRKTSAPANEYHTSIHHGNFTQELLKQSQNTKYLLSQGHDSGRSGGNSANSSSNVSDTSFSSGGSQTATHTHTGLIEHSGSLGSLLSRDEGAQMKKRPEHSSRQQQGKVSGGGNYSRKPHLDVSPLSSENSSPRSSNRNLSEMSSEESLSTRLRPGVTNNTTKTSRSLKTSNTNLEADLIRLINPDLAESDLVGIINSSSRRLPYRLKRTMSDESLHSQKGGLGSDLETNLKDVLFSTTPSRLSPATQEQTHKEQRLSPRAVLDITGPIPWRGQSGIRNPTHVSVPLPKSAASLEWASLVDVATKAIEGAETSSPKEQAASSSSSSSTSQINKDTHAEALYKQNSRDRLMNTASNSNSQLVWRSVVSNPQQRILELENKVQTLQAELEKERQENAQLEAEVQHLRAENVRLQEESQTAAAQLRRFTEWFFSTIDRQ